MAIRVVIGFLGVLVAVGPLLPLLSPLPVVAQATLTWATKASMPTARSFLGAAAPGNGKIYAIGGEVLATIWSSAAVEEYDPATNTWATKANMPTSRKDLGVAAASNGKIYAIGGYRTDGAHNFLVATVEEYDPATNTWTTKASMPTARGLLGVAAASNGKIYAIGGDDPTINDFTGTVEEYDPATNTWATRASMPTPRVNLGVAAGSNGKVYAIGGRNASGEVATVEEYDPASNTWVTKASMPTARAYVAVAAVGGKLYAVGGAGGTVEEYDPAANAWATQTRLPSGRGALGLAAFSDNRIYAVGGGSSAGGFLATNEEGTFMAPTNTPTRTSTPTASPTATPTATRTATSTPTATPPPTPTRTPMATPTPTVTSAPTPTPSSTFTPTGTPTPSPTGTLPPTFTACYDPTPLTVAGADVVLVIRPQVIVTPMGSPGTGTLTSTPTPTVTPPAATPAPSLTATETPEPQIPICHITGSATNPYELISVPLSAFFEHLLHGDVLPDAEGRCPGAAQGTATPTTSTPTPTLALTAGPSRTPTTSPGATFPATQTPAPRTPTPTPGAAPLGRGLAVTYLGGRQVQLSWQGGAGVPILVRITNEGVVPIRPGSVTSHVDSVAPGASLACYVAVAVTVEGRAIANSDLLLVAQFGSTTSGISAVLCAVPGAATGLGGPARQGQVSTAPGALRPGR